VWLVAELRVDHCVSVNEKHSLSVLSKAFIFLFRTSTAKLLPAVVIHPQESVSSQMG